ncbi:MAG: hypothetical protein CVT75_12120 [Alphaproteobacteria bacterium HGW-Alphaproteobacteria-14]|nr:MAG: hypothetical protein CVT75_12120 [Alphaproteobacteria bacterium HGW-Alphaproteobacteria-14]
MVMSAVIAGLLCATSYFVLASMERDNAVDELLPIFFGPAIMLSVGFVGLLLNWSTIVPYSKWIESDAEAITLRGMVRPRIKVLNSGVCALRSVQYGITQRTLGGTKQTILRIAPPYFCVDVENTSEVSLADCAAYIRDFKKVGESQISEWQTIPLPWLPVAEDKIEKIDLAPGARRTFFLFSAFKDRVAFVSDLMPVGMVSLIDDNSQYEGCIVITAANGGTKKVPFNLVCKAPGDEPVLTLFAGQE